MITLLIVTFTHFKQTASLYRRISQNKIAVECGAGWLLFVVVSAVHKASEAIFVWNSTLYQTRGIKGRATIM